MDYDVRNTEYCIGFSTAITRASDAIQRQRTTVGSHERIGIFRVFGRDAGFTALYTAYATSIRCVVPTLSWKWIAFGDAGDLWTRVSPLLGPDAAHGFQAILPLLHSGRDRGNRLRRVPQTGDRLLNHPGYLFLDRFISGITGGAVK